MTEQELEAAVVIDFYTHVSAVAIRILRGSIKIGDVLRFKGAHTDFIIDVSSIQKEHLDVKEAHTDEIVGIKVNERVRIHDKVYKVIAE